MARFNGKVALVTGASAGIGLAIAQRLSVEGAKVFTAQRSHDNNFHSIVADLSNPDAPAHVIDTVISKAGQLDIIVNNAGVMLEGLVEKAPVDDWNLTLAVNERSLISVLSKAWGQTPDTQPIALPKQGYTA